MTTIKNKQTGETLTGEVNNPTTNYFTFNGRGISDNLSLRHDEWEILPPPLPTGLGAVVKTESGNVWIRVMISGAEPWAILEAGNSKLPPQRYPNSHIERCGVAAILSEGVQL